MNMEVKDYFENYGEGWISLYRSLKKHWLWQDKPFTKGQAWIDMLMQCNHADNKVNIGNAVILCKRGESLNSLDTWAKDWGWHKSRVKRFLELLKNDSMIDLKSTHNTTHLIILNYDTYQKHRNANRTPIERKQNEAETKPTLNNKDNNVNNEKKRDSGDKKKSPSPADVVKNFFEMHYNENKRDETYLKYENRFPDIEECRKSVFIFQISFIALIFVIMHFKEIFNNISGTGRLLFVATISFLFIIYIIIFIV